MKINSIVAPRSLLRDRAGAIYDEDMILIDAANARGGSNLFTVSNENVVKGRNIGYESGDGNCQEIFYRERPKPITRNPKGRGHGGDCKPLA